MLIGSQGHALQSYHYRKSRPEHLNPVRPIDTRRGRRVNRLFSYHRYWQEPNMKLGLTVFCPETVLRSVYGSRLRGVFRSPLRLRCQADFCQAINVRAKASETRITVACLFGVTSDCRNTRPRRIGIFRVSKKSAEAGNLPLCPRGSVSTLACRRMDGPWQQRPNVFGADTVVVARLPAGIQGERVLI